MTEIDLIKKISARIIVETKSCEHIRCIDCPFDIAPLKCGLGHGFFTCRIPRDNILKQKHFLIDSGYYTEEELFLDLL